MMSPIEELRRRREQAVDDQVSLALAKAERDNLEKTIRRAMFLLAQGDSVGAFRALEEAA